MTTIGNNLAAAETTHQSGTELAEARAMAALAGLEFVDLDRFTPATAESLRSVVFSASFARSHRVAPIDWRDGTPVIAIASPDDIVALDDIRAAIGHEVHVVVAGRHQIERYLDDLYGRPGTEEIPGSEESQGSSRSETEVSEELVLDEHHGESSEQPAPPRSYAEPSWTGRLDEVRESPRFEEDRSTYQPAPESLGHHDPDEHASDQPADGLPVEIDSGHFEFDAEPSFHDSGTFQEIGEHPALHIAPTAPTFGEVATEALDFEAESIGDAEDVTELLTLEKILFDAGAITEDDVVSVLRERAATGRAVREIIAERNIVSEEELLRAVATESGLEFVDLNAWAIDQQAADLVPESLARRYRLLAIGFRGDRPVIAIANPSDVFALDDVRTLLGAEIDNVVCTPSQIDEYLSRAYRHNEEANLFATNAALSTAASEATQTAQTTDLNNLLAVVEDAPIVKFVNLILRQALNQRASDIHIEPSVDDLQVRFRIDGVLHHVTSAPKAIQGGVTTRLKVMADLDIAEHRIPQDGRISISAGKREIDLRVATLPTVHGEKVALRVLDKSNATLDFSRLGFQPDVITRYEAAYRKPYGTILVTGPTGSGKSTTLYATLNKLNSPERNLITVEDPVEYQLRGVNQVQVNTRSGLSFASVLRSILRSDPDVLLVGEIRDRETATIAIEAALTGHLVLTCLHTNDAASTPMRLIEMGVEPFLVGSALDCVLAQRLARVLCLNCSEPYEPTAEELQAAGWLDDDAPPDQAPEFRRAVGCQACSRTGYHGRVAIQEVMLVTEEIERAIVTRIQATEMQRIAVDQGMRPLRHDGLRKAALGITSLEEILRVVV